MSIPGPDISFEEGVLVDLTLVSIDGMVHDFFVDYNGNGAIDSSEPHSPSFSSTVNYQFTPDRTGQFTYYCSFHTATMNGNTQIIPEFTNFAVLALIVASSTIAVSYMRKNKNILNKQVNAQATTQYCLEQFISNQFKLITPIKV